MPNPDPWLQYGALGLLALVLCGLGLGFVIVARAVSTHVRDMIGAQTDLTSKIGGLTHQMAKDAIARADQDSHVRAKLHSIENDLKDALQEDTKPDLPRSLSPAPAPRARPRERVPTLPRTLPRTERPWQR